MKPKWSAVLMSLVLVFSALAPVTAQVKAAGPAASFKQASPEGMLNPDGTLNLGSGFSGALDLAGYDVQIDPQRGPVFAPARNVKSAVTPGDWAGVGDGGGVMTERIKEIAISGTNAYVVGSFTDAGNIPAADYVAKWDGTNWSALGNNGAGDGSINFYTYGVAVDGSGNVYVGGSFSSVNNGGVINNTASRIAKWNGSIWSGLGSDGAGGGSLNGDVQVIAVDGSGNVYAGGSFTDVKNGVTTIPEADYIAKWDGTNWSALGNNGAGVGALNNAVYALAVSGTDVYAGGFFQDAAGLSAADFVAKWNGSAWSAMGSNGVPGNGSIPSGYVTTLAASGATVYVGGSFLNVNNNGTALAAADYIAAWDGANWSALGSNAGNGALNNSLSMILVNGTDVYVGGDFTNAGGNGAADYIARWDGANWNALGSNGGGDGAIPNKSSPVVMSLGFLGGNLLVGGFFYDVNDGGIPQLQADHMAQWNGTHWSSVGTSPNGALTNGYASSKVEAILVSGTDVYVGGYFMDVSNHGTNITQADNLVKWDGTNWSALGSDGTGNGALHGSVSALAISGTNLYAGGNFIDAAGIPEADYVAKWDGTNWSALGNNGPGVGALPDSGFVHALAVNGTDLYVGGDFTNAGGILEADYAAKWDGANWSALGNNGAGVGALNDYVTALAIDGTGNVYAGGGFTNAAGIAEADKIAKWNGSIWTALGNNGAGNGALNNVVLALAVDGTNLYVGGYFADAGNITAADYIAKWDGTNWSALGSNGAGDGSLNNTVHAIAVSGTDVFAGGWFTNINSSGTYMPAADNVARWDGTGWSALGSNGLNNGAIDGMIYALGILGTDLLVGGQFSNISNNGVMVPEADYLAAYGIPPYTPVTYNVTKLADTNDGVCDGDCSLREAISVTQDTDHILFAPGLTGTISLVSSLSIATDITITGPLDHSIVISGGDTLRILTVQPGADVQLTNLVLTHGYVLDQNGGAVFNDGGSLVIDRTIISNSRAESTNPSYGNGGGIYSINQGNLIITNGSQVTTNTASYNGGGILAAIDSGASFSMSNSAVDHNTAYQGNGGGLYLPNPGAGTPGSIDIFGSAITDNTVAGGGGAGIYLAASANIARSYFANNSMGSFAGGGGGMKIYEGGAGSFKPITVSVTNVTFSGNTAVGQGAGAEVSLQQAADAVAFTNVTFADNHRNIMPGPPAVYGGGGIYASGAELPDLKNVIVAGNTSGVGGADCEGTFNSLDYNLVQDTTNCTLSGVTTHNITGVSANLGPLADNGYNTLTMALLWGSPAINAGDDLACPLQDQRGNARPKGAHCDLGAYELQQGAATYVSSAAQDGWVLESGQNTKLGGSMNSSQTTLRIGDDAANKQYRSILSFDTSALPDNAVITKVTLKVRKQGVTGGGDPVTMFQGFMTDIKKGTFGTSLLQITDFQATGKARGPIITSGPWYVFDLSALKGYINKLTGGSGLTQIRLRFKLNNNNNHIANFLSLYSGNAGAASRPRLVVEYYVP